MNLIRLLGICLVPLLFGLTTGHSFAQNCESVVEKYREEMSLDYLYKHREEFTKSSQSEDGLAGSYSQYGGSWSKSRENSQSSSDDEFISAVLRTSTIRAEQATMAYQACLTARSNASSGLYAWYERNGDAFSIHVKLAGPFDCKETNSPGSYKCKYQAFVGLSLAGIGSGAMNAPEHCGDTNGTSRFDQFNAQRAIPLNVGEVRSISCTGKLAGPLVVTFDGSGGSTAPTPVSLIVY